MWPLSTANGYKRYYASSSVATNTSSLSAAFQRLSTQMGLRLPDWRWPQAMNSVISINYKRAQQQMHYFQMGSVGFIGSVCCDPTCDNEILQTSQFSSNSKPCQSNCIHNKMLYLIESRVSDGTRGLQYLICTMQNSALHSARKDCLYSAVKWRYFKQNSGTRRVWAWLFLVAFVLFYLVLTDIQREANACKYSSLLDISFLSDWYNARMIQMTARHSWAVMHPRGYYYACKDDSEKGLNVVRRTRHSTCGCARIIIIFIVNIVALLLRLEVNSLFI